MWIKHILLGMFIAAMLHLLLSSGCLENITEPDDESPEKALSESMNKASEAFLSGDTTQLKTILTNDALKFYDGDFANIMQVMTEIGKGMKENRIKTLVGNYAEVEISYEGNRYIVLMALQDDDTWKIIRF